jgi:hypothetical protein
VKGQMVSTGKRRPAIVADKRFLARVRPPVHL